MSPEPNDKLLSVKELAAYLEIAKSTAIDHVLPELRDVEIRIGRLRRWKLGDVKAWVERKRGESKPERKRATG